MKPSASTDRAAQYKNRGAFRPEELRRRRDDQVVSLRRKQRDENLAKRRNLNFDNDESDLDDEDDAAGLNEPIAEQLQSLTAAVFSDNAEKQTEATTHFRRLLSRERNPPIAETIACGVVPRFVEFLRNASAPLLQFEAAWALTNIASGSSEQTQEVINHGAIPIFIELLSSPVSDVREQCVWALGNIAGDSPDLRNLVLAQGILPPLLGLLNENITKITLLRNATWCLSNLCRGKNPSPDWEAIKPALPTLAKLLYSSDEEVLTDATWAISYLSDGSNIKIQAVIDTGVCRRLVDLLSHPSTSVQTPALRAVGNIVTGDDYQTQVMLNCNVLQALNLLLYSQREALRKEACWTISNITAGTAQQVQTVIDANLIPPLVHILGTGDFKTKKEACWAISNATSNGLDNPAQIQYLVAHGVIKPLCDLLACMDNKIIHVALDALENILKVGAMIAQGDANANAFALAVEECGGTDKLYALQDHENTEIYTKSYRMIETYFDHDDEDADAPAAQVDSTGQFTFNSDMSGPQTFHFG
ncbi:Importin alpha subunit (Karyopherin alpha subunit) (Serine-rich RNA polymerase I suppressor protein) [Allomyces arbusculus]|nr:Importin alpha subunit (Karyopherin alpha subunit) (Serine-rich RNA polymerase I suppressor protein) [Allomyces arbusculus]